MAHATPDAGRRPRLEYKWKALAAVAIGTFMSTLDSSIVNVAMPTLASEFQVEITTVEWVAMAYMLTVTGLLISLGRLSDMVGRKRIYNLGLLIFTAGSALCALAGGIGVLIAARVVQGVGAAMLAANGAAILTSAFPRTERGQAMGLNGTIVGAGLTVGPSLGGVLIHAFGWRSIFTINLPVGLVGLLLATLLLRPDEPCPEQERFDFAGALGLLVCLAGLLLALSHGEAWGWSSRPILALFGVSLFSGAHFLRTEARVPYPTIDLSLFRNRLFSAASVSAVASYVAIASVVFTMPFYLQQLRGFSTAHMGLMLTVIPLTMVVVSPVSGWLSDRIGSRVLASAGMASIALGLVLLSHLGTQATPLAIMGRLFLVGLGNGLFASPNSSAIMGAVPPQRLGVASGMISTVRTTGMVLGVAIAGAVIAVRRAALVAAGLAPETAFGSALAGALLVTAAIAAAGIVPSLVRGPEERRAACAGCLATAR
ncbi:MAG: MFS transporter [Armatimonadetes bacterium]|nr:MFS transporter [Armatimonadota bacterium]